MSCMMERFCCTPTYLNTLHTATVMHTSWPEFIELLVVALVALLVLAVVIEVL